MTDKREAGESAEITWAFPSVDPGAKPLGARVLVQLRRSKQRTGKMGIILVEETKETEKWNNMVAKVIINGPLAFKKRDSMESWPEGSWCEPGDYVRVPKWGGDRWEVKHEQEEEPVLFMILNDHEMIARVTGNPLDVKAFV